MIDEVLSICSTLQYHEEWLLDSGACHHMCSHRSRFSTYQSIYESVVFMGNNIYFKIVGVGSIKIRMFDNIVRTIMEVRHVPELVMNSSGYKYIGQGGALKVSKGNLVVMKAREIGNPYKMEGKIEMSKAMIVFEEATTSYLWHKKMGYISKKGTQVWKNHELLPNLRSLNFCKFYTFVGYDDGVRGYRLWDPTTHKFVISKDMFME